MFTEKMVKIVAVTLKKWSDTVAALLLEEGIVDFTQLTNSSEVLLKYQKDDKSSDGDAKIPAILSKIEAFLKPEGILLPAPDQATLKNPDTVDTEETRKIIEDLNTSVKKIRTKQQGLQQELLKLREIKKNIESFGPDIKTPLTKNNSSFLSFRTGKVPVGSKQEIETSISRYPAVTIESSADPDGKYIFLSVIFMKRDRENIEGILNNSGWIDIEIDRKMFDSSNETASKKIDDKISTILEKQRKLEEDYSEIIKKHSKDLKERYKTLKASQLSAKVQSFFTHSSDTILFSGWLVKSGKKRIEEKLRKATHNECFIEWYEPGMKDDLDPEERDKPPVKMNNPAILAPFQMLVRNFGIPSYGTIDPTPFVVPIYLIMFGLMFADSGQGVLIAGAGTAGVFLFKNTTWKNLSMLLIWCGGSTLIFGLLFGTFFGTGLIPPIWFDYHSVVSGHSDNPQNLINSVYDILLITLYFGIGVITFGLIFNWINLVRTGKYFKLIFDKGGLLGGWLYGCGIYAAAFMAVNNFSSLPRAEILTALFLPPVILLLTGIILEHTIKEGNSLSVMDTFTIILEWLVELLEVFGGYLSNTLSFMRVAGLGIAHVSLMNAFFSMADMTESVPGSIFILIAGNILVIVLEGLSAGIQALRLNYYEFFSKFFQGTDRVYSPVSLLSDK